MDINLYIEGLRQSQEKTSRQKDILDTWEEIREFLRCPAALLHNHRRQ